MGPWSENSSDLRIGHANSSLRFLELSCLMMPKTAGKEALQVMDAAKRATGSNEVPLAALSESTRSGRAGWADVRS